MIEPKDLEATTARFRALREAIERGETVPDMLGTMSEAFQCLAWLSMQNEARKMAGVMRAKEMVHAHSRQLEAARSRGTLPGGVSGGSSGDP
jgi:hypothetical protein